MSQNEKIKVGDTLEVCDTKSSDFGRQGRLVSFSAWEALILFTPTANQLALAALPNSAIKEYYSIRFKWNQLMLIGRRGEP